MYPTLTMGLLSICLCLGVLVSTAADAQHRHPGPTRQDVHHLVEVFSDFDSNGDGFLSNSEWQACAAYLGYELTLDNIDTNGNGSVDIPELIAVVIKQPKRERSN